MGLFIYPGKEVKENLEKKNQRSATSDSGVHSTSHPRTNMWDALSPLLVQSRTQIKESQIQSHFSLEKKDRDPCGQLQVQTSFTALCISSTSISNVYSMLKGGLNLMFLKLCYPSSPLGTWMKVSNIQLDFPFISYSCCICLIYISILISYLSLWPFRILTEKFP